VKYQARVGDHTARLHTTADGARLDGDNRPARLEPLGGPAHARTFRLIQGATSQIVTVEPGAKRQGQQEVIVTIDGRRVPVELRDETAELLERFGLDAGDDAAEREVHAPMPGLVLQVLVEAGQEVKAGDGLVVLEAMKMENELRAPSDGTVAAVHCAPGDAVGKNALLLEFEA
jgi:pyruvate carboxylase subunit B